MEQVPTNKYLEQAELEIQKVETMMLEKDWMPVSNANGTSLESKNIKVCSIPHYRAIRKSKKPAQTWIDRVWKVDESIVKSDDKDALSWTIIEEGNNWRIVRQVNNMMWPIWSRELVFFQGMFERNGCYYLVMYSVNHANAPLKPKEFVRAHMHTNVYRFEERDGYTHASKTTNVDPCGNIPVSLVTRYTDKLTHMLNKIDAE